MSEPLKILLLAGEESGVIYAERLKTALRAAAPGREIVIRGYDTEGFKTGDLAVMGFWPVLRRLGYFLGVQRTMKRVLATWRPDVLVTIDYPGLNLKLAAYAKMRGIPAVHLVCPQVWAWHKNRIPKIAATLTKLLCFFPFEPALFAGTGLDVRFIGHPLVDVFADETKGTDPAQKGTDPSAPTRTQKGTDPSAATLALLPGSRVGEIRRNLPRLLQALALLKGTGPLEVCIPAANARAMEEIRRLILSTGGRRDEADENIFHFSFFILHLQQGGARDLLRKATCAVVASGTATLEAALARCPTVLVYAVSAAFAWFARRVIKDIRHIGLANIIWEKSGGTGEAPMPELLQEAFTPAAVAAHLQGLLTDEKARQTAHQRLDDAMALLHSDGDALGLAAREILSCSNRGEKS